MKGLQCKELTGIDALTLTELEDPKPGPDEVCLLYTSPSPRD